MDGEPFPSCWMDLDDVISLIVDGFSDSDSEVEVVSDAEEAAAPGTPEVLRLLNVRRTPVATSRGTAQAAPEVLRPLSVLPIEGDRPSTPETVEAAPVAPEVSRLSCRIKRPRLETESGTDSTVASGSTDVV